MPSSAVVCYLLCLCLSGCASYPDIRGRDSAAREWARKEREREQKARAAGSSLPPPATNMSASSESNESRGQAPAPPPLPAPAPAPARAPVPSAATSTPAQRELVGLGTCFAVDDTGTLVTASHVVKGSRSVAVRFADGDLIPAKVVRLSEATDVAVLKVEGTPPDFLSLAAPRNAHLGLSVFTIGFPDPDSLGTEAKFTDGTVSGLSGMGDASVMQISVPVQPGNSGGPLVNDQGEVVGVIVSRADDFSFYKRTGTIPQNVNFATKSENLLTLLPASTPRTKTASRDAAIERASKAVCLVVTHR